MTKKLLAAFALFSLFFGAGNLILPPYLGVQAGTDWALVAFGFVISAVLIPILGIFAHAKLQGTIYDFGAPLGKWFSFVYAALIYGIALALPAPRTASVTHEMAVMPFTDTPYWGTSLLYFSLVFFVAVNRSKILDFFGKITTPLILGVLLFLIAMAVFSPALTLAPTQIPNPFGAGLLEGYQTFDAIAAVVIGGVLLVSIKKVSADEENYLEQKKTVRFAAFFSAAALALIYIGLIYAGAQSQAAFFQGSSRTEILQGVAQLFLGPGGPIGLSVLVALACFTTAVGIVTGTADYVASFFEGADPTKTSAPAKKAFVITALIGALLGVVMGQLPVNKIIAIAVPALVFIYPITIILMALHVLPKSWGSPAIFKAAVAVCFLANTPSFLDSLGFSSLQEATIFMPFSAQGLAWMLPVLLAVLVTKFTSIKRQFPL